MQTFFWQITKNKILFHFPHRMLSRPMGRASEAAVEKGREALSSSVGKEVAVISAATPGKLERLGERAIEKGVEMW